MRRLAILSDAWLTPERVRRIAVVFALLAAAAVAGDVWLHTRHGLADAQGVPLARDFVNYWSGAHLAGEGHPARVYDLDAFAKYERAHTAANAIFKWYSYPPVALLLSLPLAALGFVPGLVFWTLSGILICASLLSRYFDGRLALLAAAATPASLMNILSGQNGQFSAALLGGGVMLLGRRPRIAGMLFGMLAFKPHLAILVPVALAAGGYWRAFAAAAATALALCAGSALLFGTEAWAGFLHNAPINVRILENGAGFWPRMPTPYAAMALLGGGTHAAWWAQGISALAAACVTLRVWHGAASMELKGAALILATFLVTPYAWDYDLVALTFVMAWVAADAARTGFLPLEKLAIGLAIAMPLLFLPPTGFGLQLDGLCLWGALLAVARRCHVQNAIGTRAAAML